MFQITMYKQSIGQITRAPVARVSIIVTRSYSILGGARKTLDNINHKIGKAAADTLDAAENIAHDAKDKVEEVTWSVKSGVEDVAEEIKDKTYEARQRATQADQDTKSPNTQNRFSKMVKESDEIKQASNESKGQTLEQKATDIKQRFEEAKQKVKDQFD